MRAQSIPFSGATATAGLFASLFCVSAASADMIDTTASASIVTPISIASAAPMAFGEIARPSVGTCNYVLSPDGTLQANGAAGCRTLGGSPFAAEFEVECGSDRLVRFDLTYANAAPDGALFSSGTAPVSVDGRTAGPAFQVHPCDTDGRSVVQSGGQLSVDASLAGDFSGQVGTITLEAIYD